MSHRGISRRRFIQTAVAGLAPAALAPGAFAASGKGANGQPNVLFIAVDDLNDWTGCLGGHPDAKTPNLDRLASRGVLFTQAYCAAPACNPSRAALMTGIRPSTSGVYHNDQPWRQRPVLKDIATIPQHFMAHGYEAMGSGKIYHGRYPDPPSWQTYWPSLTNAKPDDPYPPADTLPVNGIPNARHFDWSPVDAPVEEMGDWQVADWVIGQLERQHDAPFFLACGFFRPHLPWYVPQEYFDRFPLDEVDLPVVNENDLDDVPQAGRDMARTEADHVKVKKHNQWRKAVQGYLASGAFADDCIGRVLDALDRSPHRDNTVIVLWSDHGWHLGEKLHWRKFALWEEATHNVMLFVAPGVTQTGGRCDAPVNLLDIYPTLLDLCGLPPREGLEGVSLTPLLRDPKAEWDVPTLTTHGYGNHSVRARQWRYIRYNDGSEELYNHEDDPLEWKNLAGDEAYAPVKAELSRALPKTNAEPIPSDR